MGGAAGVSGPDLTAGVSLAELEEGRPLLGHVGEEAVMLVRRGERVLAVGSTCTHYGGPLAEGLVEGSTVRCPWHHACFDLETGMARGPALQPITCYSVAIEGGKVRVGDKLPAPKRRPKLDPKSIVLVGAGAAAAACADRLRGLGYDGPVTMLGAEGPPGPVDRPNLSKDYLAGAAPEEWVALGGEDRWRELSIELRADDPVLAIDAAARVARTRSGKSLAYEALLLATGAEPVRPEIPGLESARTFTLRSVADARAIIAAAEKGGRALVVGAGFIGLEAAASLTKRGVEVTVVAPGALPLQRALGPEIGKLLRQVHEAAGVRFLLGRRVTGFSGRRATLSDGAVVEADFVLLGLGVKPRLELAKTAGLAIDGGVLVDSQLKTSVSGIWAAGDIAAYDDAISGQRQRIEHWAVAERQGQAVAASMLGEGVAYRDVPFFWTAQHDVTVSYVGTAPAWDEVRIKGSLEARQAIVGYLSKGRVLAVATVGNDGAALVAEACFARGDGTGLLELLG